MHPAFRMLIPVLAAAAIAAAQPPATAPAEPQPPRRTSFHPDRPAGLEVVRAISGHLLVKPLVNGKDVGWFIFDTGAGITCIDKSVADELELPDTGGITASGMGGNRQSRLRSLGTLSLGPVALEELTVLELDLKGFHIFMGKPIAGVIGYDTFLAAVYEIDFESPAIRVHDPSSYTLPQGNAWGELTLIRRRPYVSGQIESNEPGLFVLDIGSNTPLIVHAQAVRKFKLLEDGRPTRQSVSGGVGGLKRVKGGTVRRLLVCGREVADVQATFSEATEGVLASDEAQGTVGVGSMRGYRLVVNYAGGKVALVR